MSDLIRREDVEKAIQGLHIGDIRFFEKLRKNIDAIPSAEPERTAKVEHQGTTHGYWMGDCSECQNRVDSFMIFCPHCGCRLIWGDDES